MVGELEVTHVELGFFSIFIFCRKYKMEKNIIGKYKKSEKYKRVYGLGWHLCQHNDMLLKCNL